MVVEEVIGHPLRLMMKQPKIVLPNVLSWIPTALINLIIILAVADLIPYAGEFTGGYSPDMLIRIISIILPYILAIIPVIILSFLISVFIQGVYPSIIKQSFAKKVDLAVAFSVAKKRFWSMLWTQLIVAFLIFVLISVVMALMFGIGFSVIILPFAALFIIPLILLFFVGIRLK